MITLTTPRHTRAELECQHHEPDPDTTNGTPCGWSGHAVVDLWDDTREVLWHCPDGHENSEPWTDFN